MKHLYRRIIAFLVALAVGTIAFGAEWYVCLGAYAELSQAEERARSLAVYNIPCTIKKFGKSTEPNVYRVFYGEKLSSQSQAERAKSSLLANSMTKEILGDEVWYFSITKKYVPHQVDPSKRIISVKDSDTGKPVKGAKIKIDNSFEITTSSDGTASLPEEIVTGNHTILITKEKYVPTENSFGMAKGEINTTAAFSIPKAVEYNRIKIVLDWGETPEDLDAHVLSNNDHVYFSKKTSGNLVLDRDDTDGYGPETITIRDPSATDVYKIYVFDYTDKNEHSTDKFSNSGAQVSLWFDNDYKGTYKIKPGVAGVWWHVLDIVNKNEVVVIDTVSDSF